MHFSVYRLTTEERCIERFFVTMSHTMRKYETLGKYVLYMRSKTIT
jgi:hypothetical protein